jgi:hypothetical protein
MKKLDQPTIDAINAATFALTQAAENVPEFIAGKSDKWRDSEKGEAYDSWAEKLEEIAANLEDLPESVDAI